MAEINKNKLAFRKIQEAENILLVTHVRPDEDALSSLAIMIDLMENLGKKYTAFCKDEPSFSFSFLPHLEKIKTKKENLDFSNFNLIISLDCGSLSRTGLIEEIKERKKDQLAIEFDHHPHIDNYSDIEIRDPEASSTTEILYHFLKINKIKINKIKANCILTGILTDTSNFLHQSTSRKSVSIASEMLRSGARFGEIVRHTWQNKNLETMKIWGSILSNLQINKKYNIAFSLLTFKDTKKFSNKDVLSGVSTFLGNLKGVKAVILLSEEKNPATGEMQIKGSMRTSRPEIDVSKLAVLLGGGGHIKAAGFMLNGSLTKTKNKWQIV